MASLYSKKIHGKTYWYLREMARVQGKPKMVSERYVGTAADVEALLDAREQAVLPDRTRHLAFGDVAAVWGILEELGVAGIIDESIGAGQCHDLGVRRGSLVFSLPWLVELVACHDVRPRRALSGRGCGLIGARSELD